MLFGPYICKVGVFPTAPELLVLTDAPLDVSGKPNGIREAVVDFFLKNGGGWDLRVQLCSDIKTMPIEQAAVAWSEEESPYVPVARIDRRGPGVQPLARARRPPPGRGRNARPQGGLRDVGEIPCRPQQQADYRTALGGGSAGVDF